MDSQKLKDLREKMMNEMETVMVEFHSHSSRGDVIRDLMDIIFDGCKGLVNETNEEFLEAYKNEMWEHYEECEDEDTLMYVEQDDKAVRIRSYASEFELELVAERELLGE